LFDSFVLIDCRPGRRPRPSPPGSRKTGRVFDNLPAVGILQYAGVSFRRLPPRGVVKRPGNAGKRRKTHENAGKRRVRGANPCLEGARRRRLRACDAKNPSAANAAGGRLGDKTGRRGVE